MTTLLSLQEAHELAQKEWKNYRIANNLFMSGRNFILRVLCKNCLNHWRMTKPQNKEEKPPAWPPDYAGQPCPQCGEVLPQASIPF